MKLRSSKINSHSGQHRLMQKALQAGVSMRTAEKAHRIATECINTGLLEDGLLGLKSANQIHDLLWSAKPKWQRDHDRALKVAIDNLD
jgi:hypothetical protein